MTGARLTRVPLKIIPETFRLVIPEEDVALTCRVCWINSSEIGVEFIADPEFRRRYFD